MKEKFAILVKIQEIDTQMDVFRSRVTELSPAFEALDAQLREAETAVEDAKERVDAAKEQYRSLESDLKDKDEAIRKSQSKLHAIKTNKEYQAMRREIEEMKKATGVIEDEMLTILDSIEAAEAEVVQTETALEAAKESVTAERERLEGTLEEARKNISELEKNREAVAREVDSDLMAALEEVKERTQGPAVVPVRSAVCDGCNMNIPPQLFNELHRCDSLKFCPFCNRIIYWEKLLEAN